MTPEIRDALLQAFPARPTDDAERARLRRRLETASLVESWVGQLAGSDGFRRNQRIRVATRGLLLALVECPVPLSRESANEFSRRDS
jgi:hypothetical protein